MNEGNKTARLRLDEFLPYRLSITSNAVSKAIAHAYDKRFGLAIPEWRILAVLNEIDSGTQQDLVARTLMDKVAVSRAAQSLVKRGLVKRRPDSDDGRAHRLTLSAAGAALYSRIAPVALEYERRLLEHFRKDQIAGLNDMLALLANAAGILAEKDVDTGLGPRRR
jgi:DNA-binding MarR family transcriptional regulator